MALLAGIQFLLFGMGWYQLVTGTLMQDAVWHVSREKWEVGGYLLSWPWWVPGVSGVEAWEGMSVVWS